MNIFAYIRVSTDKQDLDNQKFGVMEYAKKKKYTPIIFFEDQVSGKKSWKERGLKKLIDQTKKGDVLLVSEISRLARSTLQVLEFLQEAANKEISVHIVKSNMIMDDSLNSKITAVVLGLAAEIERDFISARTTEALAKRKAEGLPIGRRKGSVNLTKKLDKRKDDIIDMLSKGIYKTEIAKFAECTPETLYRWMYANNLARYIDSNKATKAAVKTRKKKSTESGDKAEITS